MFWCCLICDNECSAIKIFRLRPSDDGAKRYQNFAALRFFDANSELFKENVDDTMYKNPYEI